MSLDCTNIKLQKGSTGASVKEVQTILKNKGYYTGKIDGDFGYYTEQAVKQFQSKNNLIVDGWVGSITCNKLQSSPNGIYTNYTLCETQGGDCLGQITGYHCGAHALKQALRKFGITKYTERTIGSYAGTTTSGTSHQGLNTAIATIASKEGIKLQVEWVNFSDLGSNRKERFKKLGELLTDKKKSIVWHEYYRKAYGHYSLAKMIDIINSICTIPNSLGSKCNSPAYCGYMESRDFGTQESYFKGISQKSICIITKV